MPPSGQIMSQSLPSLRPGPEWDDEDEPDEFPGPGSYDVKSTLGKQQGYPNPPEYSMTWKNPKSWRKVLITKNHREFPGKDSPGSIYNLPEEFGAHPVASNWAKDRRHIGEDGKRPQGPGKYYNVRKDVGYPAQGRIPNRTQGLSRRFWVPGHDLLVGPGQYEHKSSLGGPGGTFGTGFRAYDHVWYQDCERNNLGRASPGPGPYRQDFGKDCLQCPLGLDMKLRPVKLSDTPQTMGPGYYNINKVKQGSLSHEQSRYPTGCTFGKPRRKRGRFDFKKLRGCGDSPNFFCAL